VDEGEKARSELVISGGNTTKLFELQEETLNQMALFVAPSVEKPRGRLVGLGQDAEVDTAISDVPA
jgi:hypothetical protein